MVHTNKFTKNQIDGTSLKPIYINTTGEMILKGNICWSDPIAPGNRIILADDYHDKGISIVLTDATVTYLPSDDSQECDTYILARVKDNQCTADFICRGDIFRASGNACIEPNEKYNTLQWFASLKPEQRDHIVTQIHAPLFDNCSSSMSAKITGARNLLYRYHLTKATYTPQQQADIEEMFECFHNHSSSHTQKQKAEDRLKKLLNINTTSDYECSLKKSEIIAALHKEIYKNEAAVELIVEALVTAKYTKQKGVVFLLEGNPGVGKTTFGKAIAKVCNRPFARLCNS